jgi:heme-degrading monooxygenase HmoA
MTGRTGEKMSETFYTLALWRVKPESEAEFIKAWKDLNAIFYQLPAPPAGRGTLVQSLSEPTLFYSFGPWHSLEDIQAMRENPQAQGAIKHLIKLCTEAIPGSFQLIAES